MIILPACLGILKPQTSGPALFDLYAWGDGSGGAFGDGSPRQLRAPALVGSAMDIAYITSSISHSAYIDSSGDMWACGANTHGELGLGDASPRISWSLVPRVESRPWKKVLQSVDGFSVASTSDGYLYHVGSRVNGTDGSGATSADNSAWTLIPVMALDFDIGRNFVVAQYGGVYVWGNNGLNQCAQGATTPTTPMPVSPALWINPLTGLPEQLIVAGSPPLIAATDQCMSVFFNSYDILGSGRKIWTCGRSEEGGQSTAYGYLAVGGFSGASITVPNLYRVLRGTKSHSATYGSLYCAKYESGSGLSTVLSWHGMGRNANGELAQGHTSAVTGLTEIPWPSDSPIKDMVILDGGTDYSASAAIAVTNDGKLWGVGSDKLNGLGISGTGNTLAWTQIGTDTDWDSIAGNGSCVFAMKRLTPLVYVAPPADDEGWVDGVSTPPTISLTTTSLSKYEGSYSYTPRDVEIYTFELSITGSRTWNCYFDFAITGSGANPADANDFLGHVFPSGTAGIIPSLSKSVVNIFVLRDHTAEADNEFTLTISNPVRCVLGANTTAIGTIINDD